MNILPRGTAIVFLECLGKGIDIHIATSNRYLLDAHAALRQQFNGALHAVIGEVFLRRDTQILTEQRVEIASVDINVLCRSPFESACYKVVYIRQSAIHILLSTRSV